jgi:hypothetical protein
MIPGIFRHESRPIHRTTDKKNSPKFACGLLDEIAWVRGSLITFNTNLSRFSADSQSALTYRC